MALVVQLDLVEQPIWSLSFTPDIQSAYIFRNISVADPAASQRRQAPPSHKHFRGSSMHGRCRISGMSCGIF